MSSNAMDANISTAMFSALGADVPIDEAVQIVAPMLNKRIEDFEACRSKDGVQTFQEHLLATIVAANLSVVRWVKVDNVGVHPDNREKAGLVPVDVHDLLLRISASGWSWKAVDALACEIPPTSIGAQWRDWNASLAKASDGLLAPVNRDLLELLTGRGSHTTASVRCYKYGTKGFHDDLCIDGFVSQSKIVERQPSMAEPLEKGLPYLVIRWQLVVACPRLTEVLSRTGNAAHGVARVQTTLQALKRVHALATIQQSGGRAPDWDIVRNSAAMGMSPEFKGTAQSLCDFVRVWSGGADGHIRTDLESFERTLTVKRKVAPSDLRAFSKLELAEAPRYVTAMVKALLSAPPMMVHDGVANIFSNTDLFSLSVGGKNRQFALEACRIMIAGSNFLDAYSRLDETEKLKYTSELEVRCVMHVHQKKADTRVNFPSLLHIAAAMYNSVLAAGHELPKWHLLAPIAGALDDTAASSSGGCLREVTLTGAITDTLLHELGFQVGALVAKKGTKEADGNEVFTILKISEDAILLEREHSTELATISRADATSGWQVRTLVAEEAPS
jgi:hypothetical protein